MIKKNNIINGQNLQNLITGNLNNAISSNMIFAKGMIIAWYGFINNVPKTWAICNGENGTPDLRNKFIMGVGDMSNFAKIVDNLLLNLKSTIFHLLVQEVFLVILIMELPIIKPMKLLNFNLNILLAQKMEILMTGVQII